MMLLAFTFMKSKRVPMSVKYLLVLRKRLRSADVREALSAFLLFFLCSLREVLRFIYETVKINDKLINDCCLLTGVASDAVASNMVMTAKMAETAKSEESNPCSKATPVESAVTAAE